MPFAEVNDINMHYEIHGQGEPLVLIMGLGGDLTRWFRILPFLAEEFQVIAFDNRGAGKTDKPDIPYSMEMMSNDIAGLMDVLGIESAHIFGISLGGMIAQNFALLHPEKVRTLILGCTRCGGDFSITDDSQAMAALSPEYIENLSAEERSMRMLPFLYSQEFIDANPDLMNEMIALGASTPIDLAAYNRQMEAARSHDTYERLPQINAPTLVISGGADKLIPAANSPILSERIPGAELVILEKLGHGFYSEENRKTASTIIDFIKRKSPREG